MGRNDASWMDEEDERAEQQVETGKRPNAEAPQLVRKEAKAPTRSTKGFYIQEKYAMAFDKLVFSQKQVKGKKRVLSQKFIVRIKTGHNRSLCG